MGKHKLFKVICGGVLACLVALLPVVAPIAYADTCKSETSLAIISIKPWYSGLCKTGTDDVQIVKIPDDFIVLALNLLSIAIQVAGYVAVGFVIWGGIKYILASGDSGKIASAKNTIQNALIGLLIVLVAVTMVDFVTGLYS